MNIAFAIGMIALFVGAIYGLLVGFLWLLGSTIARLCDRATGRGSADTKPE